MCNFNMIIIYKLIQYQSNQIRPVATHGNTERIFSCVVSHKDKRSIYLGDGDGVFVKDRFPAKYPFMAKGAISLSARRNLPIRESKAF
jgi:hypothetical protein